MPTRLVDCTYLNGVARCLRGAASHSDDLVSFLRFAGELLLSEKVLFTADRSGPVYKPALEASRQIEETVRRGSFLEHFDIEKVDYHRACQQASADVAADLRYLPSFARSVGPLSPEFEALSVDPDALLLDELKLLISDGSSPPPSVELKPANATRFVLSQSEVLSALRETEILERFSGGEEFLRLSSAVRAMIYRNIGNQLGAQYLPSSSRAKVLPAATRIPAPLVSRVTADGPPAASASSVSVASAVDALVRISAGSPHEILKRAAELHLVYRPIREALSPEYRGDALGDSFRAGGKVRELEFTLSQIVDRSAIPTSLADCIDLRLFFFILPVFSVNAGLVRKWLRNKLYSSRISGYADLIWYAKGIEADPAYMSLYRAVGLFASRQNTPGRANVLIGYSVPDSILAVRLSEALKARGVGTWLRDTDASSRDPLHDIFRKAVTECRRVLLLFSESSLADEDFSYLLEQTLEREAREGGSSVLLPIAVDNSAYEPWTPARLEIARRRDEVLSRVIGDFRLANSSAKAFEEAADNLARALNRIKRND